MTEQPDLQSPEPEIPQDNWFEVTFGEIIAANDAVIASYDAQYAIPQKQNLTWQALGAVQSFQKIENGVLLATQHGTAELVFLANNLLRVQVQWGNARSFAAPFSYAIAKQAWQTIAVGINDGEERLTAITDAIQVDVDRNTAHLTIFNNAGRQIYAERAGVTQGDQGTQRLSVQLAPDEAAYGTGERTFPLNLRGRKLALWNLDHGAYEYGLDPINYCVPLYIGVHQQGVYGIFWDNPGRGSMDIGAAQADELLIESDFGSICYYVFIGKTVNDVLARFTELTGRMPMPPLWALGFHQCRYSYLDREDVLKTAHELRRRNIPCDVLYLDIHYMDGYRIFTWDKKAFADLAGMIEELHQMGFKLVVIIDPGVKVDPKYAVYQSGLAEDVFMKYPDGEVASGVVWPGLCHFPDFTKPTTRLWWRKQFEALLAAGVDGIWNDMNEPAYFEVGRAGNPPDYLQHDYEGHGGTHGELHNLYGMMMARSSNEALQDYRPEQRQFNMTRAGYAGTQRYASSWTGDNIASWNDLRLSITTILNMALSGQSFTGADVGGYAKDTTAELLTRWTQANVMLPYYRNHSAVDSVRQEIWRFGQPFEAICRAAIELRYQLLPYLYTAFAECHFYGKPIVHPIFTLEPDNPHIRSIDDCYVVGDALLIAPILEEYALRRTVYLPQGDWYDFWTHERYTGGHLISVEAPLDKLPVFVKSGAVLPMYPIMQHTREKTLDTLILRIYADTGETHIYEDAGEGLGYLQGDYRWVTIVCTETANTLLIERQVSGTFIPSYSHLKIEMLGARSRPTKIDVEGVTVEGWTFENGVLTVFTPPFEQMLITTEL